MPASLPETWNGLRTDIENLNRRLAEGISRSLQASGSLCKDLAGSYRDWSWKPPEPGRLASLASLVGEQAREILFTPLRGLERAHPQQILLASIEEYESGMEDALRRLPQVVSVSRADIHAALKPEATTSRWTLWHPRRSQPAPLALREVVRQAWSKELMQCSPVLGDAFLLLARTSLALLTPWQWIRQENLRSLQGGRPELNDLMRERERWLAWSGTLESGGSGILVRFEGWKGRMLTRIAAAVARRSHGLSERQESVLRLQRQSHFVFWSRQQRSTTAICELEASVARLLSGVVEISQGSLQSLAEEHGQLLQELDGSLSWLQQWQSGSSTEPYPPPIARLASAEDRVRQWGQQCAELARMRLAAQVESIVPDRSLPAKKPRWRQLQGRASWLRHLESGGRPSALRGFAEAEAGHGTLVRSIERAREVAEFSLEAAAAMDEEGIQVAADGMANAIQLVARQRETASDYGPVAEQALTEGLARTFYEFHIEMEEGRLGFLAHLVRQRGTHLIQAASRTMFRTVRTVARRAWRILTGAYQKLLIWGGWAAPIATAREPVERRDYLGELLHLQAIPKVLPPIYRRLFRLVPLEDSRFLVGRDAEMAAITDARRLWESGRAVSLVVVGARGSGKTSLLNCAGSSVLSGIPFLRGQFDRRLRDAAGMTSFLASLLQADPADLDATLKASRRVIVLEEVERTFLRRIGGFQALRFLLERIAQTSRTTLWILSLNEQAFQYLDGVFRIGDRFSHRLNAMAVAPEHLRNAILLRHNLSGLRLQFAQPSLQRRKGKRIRRFLGVQKGAEEAFFDSLYLESDGIFRAAFELWQQSIDRVESGVLYMLPPMEEHYDSILGQLTLQDSHTLQAVLQHGSLTAEEHAAVFECRLESSLEQLERLASWEFVEQDPVNPGYRVCPEAGRVVRIALHRQVLL